MHGTLQITITQEAHEASKSMAEPFVDTESSVILRLVAEVKQSRTNRDTATAIPPAKVPADIQRASPPQLSLTPVAEKPVRSGPSHLSYFLCNGVRIPVGTLRARYGPRVHYKTEITAEVKHYGIVVNGMEYYEPSPAAEAAKLAAGASEVAAPENGWRFWEYLNPETGQWERLEKLRRR
jgi:hypothetical protein